MSNRIDVPTQLMFRLKLMFRRRGRRRRRRGRRLQ